MNKYINIYLNSVNRVNLNIIYNCNGIDGVYNI